MSILEEIGALMRKELSLEWKQKYAFNGLLLYVMSMVVVISLAFVNGISLATWNVVYWLIVLFAAINAVAKSFMSETPGQMLYLYTLAHPSAIILSKMLYNFLILTIVSLLAWLGFSVFNTPTIANPGLFAAVVILGSAAFSANLTLVTAIAARAENRTTLLAVLSFPLIVPILLTLIRATSYAIQGIDPNFNYKNLYLIAGMTVGFVAASVVLFPFLWRE